MVERLEGHRDLGGPASLLVALVVLSPWPFGCAALSATRVITVVASLAVLVALLWGDLPTSRAQPAAPCARLDLAALAVPSLLGLFVLALVQVLPLPPTIQSLVAPGSSAVWHPADVAAAAVLGPGARPVSLDPAATLRWLAFSAAVVSLALVTGRRLRSRTILLRASASVVLGALLVAVYGLVARLLFGDKLYGLLAVPTITPFGPFVSKNHFAGYVEMATCLAVGLATGLADEARRRDARLSWLDGRRAPWVVVAWGVVLVLILAVPISLSRGGVISLAAGLAAFAALRLGSRRTGASAARKVVLSVSASAAVVVALALLLPEDARGRVRTLGSVDPSGSYRLGIWRDSLRLFAASPVLGSGFGSVADALPRFKTGAGDVRVEHVENDSLELLCEGGLLAAALAAVVLGSLAAGVWRSVRDEPHRLPRAVRTGAIAGLLAVLVHSALDFNLRIPSNALLAAFLLACVLPPSVTPGDRAEQGWLQRILRPALLALSGLALALGVLGAWTPREVDTGALRRATAESAGLRGAALERDVMEHVQRRPADAYAWTVLAWLRLPKAPQDADALAAWAQRLDPQRIALRAAAQRVRDAAQSQPRRP